MSNTFIKEFTCKRSELAILEANQYAKENRLDIVCIDTYQSSSDFTVVVVFRVAHEICLK